MENDPKHVHPVWQPLWHIIQETSWDCEQHTSIRHRPMPRTWPTTQIPTQQQMVRNSGLNGPVLRTDAFWGMEKVKLWWVRTFLKGRSVRLIPQWLSTFFYFSAKNTNGTEVIFYTCIYLFLQRWDYVFQRKKFANLLTKISWLKDSTDSSASNWNCVLNLLPSCWKVVKAFSQVCHILSPCLH